MLNNLTFTGYLLKHTLTVAYIVILCCFCELNSLICALTIQTNELIGTMEYIQEAFDLLESEGLLAESVVLTPHESFTSDLDKFYNSNALVFDYHHFPC